MILLSAGVVLLPVVTGGLVVHWLWPEREIKVLIFKAFLGIGVGLGLSSLFYFLYLLLFPGGHWYIFVEVAACLVLLSVTLLKEAKRGWGRLPSWNLTRLQNILVALSLAVFVISLLSTASYLLRRRQGDWDAWMMYNRAARFVYRDQPHWLASFSRQMDPIFHPDYPLLLAMNIASGWDALGSETSQVPMLVSALFAMGCLGILVSALALLKSVGQAALGLIVFWGTPAVVNEGARQLADVPLAFYFLGTVILIYLYASHKQPQLIVLAGLAAGLAAWTKNEGSLFVMVSGLALGGAFFQERPLRLLGWYAAGLAFPLAVLLYFKLFLAPPSDVLSNGAAHAIQQMTDPQRHLEILLFFASEFLTFGGWTLGSLAIGVIPILWVFYPLFRSPVEKVQVSARLTGIIILALQTLGYYGIYLISPYPIEWHLNFSIQRIFLQLFPVITFLILCASRTPEAVFEAQPAARI